MPAFARIKGCRQIVAAVHLSRNGLSLSHNNTSTPCDSGLKSVSFMRVRPGLFCSATLDWNSALTDLTAQDGSNNGHHTPGSNLEFPGPPDLHALTFWRVEESLADLGAVRPVACFTWNSHTYAGRWARRGGMLMF